MANLIGMLIGAAVDRQDGDSGIKGAIIGSVAQSAIKVVFPVVATYALGRAVLYGIQRSASTGSVRANKVSISK